MKKLLILTIFSIWGIWSVNAQKGQRIYIDVSQHIELDNPGDGRTPDGPLSDLQNGDTTHQAQEGYGKILDTDNFYIPINAFIDSVKLFSYQGSGANPWLLYGVNNGKETLIASFKGGQYNKWIKYVANHLAVTQLHIQTIQTPQQPAYWPTEWQWFGTQSQPQVTTVNGTPQKIYLTDQFGINMFAWDIQLESDPSQLKPVNYNQFKAFTGARMYIDWKKLEKNKGLNTFQQSLDGAWYFDKLITDLEAIGITPLFCFKTDPDWVINTYPANVQSDENAPMMYTGKRGTLPVQYKEQARTAFQIALRYGSTLHPLSEATIDPTSLWNGFVVTKPLSGLGTLKYIENNNEPDRWWKTAWAYQTSFENAANMSAFYDGDEGRLGAGYGVKTADPTMQVVMGGLAQPDASYLRGLAVWAKVHRKDGKPPYDIINVHDYCLTKQPEGTLDIALIPAIQEAANQGKPIWLTEVGWDLNQGSPNHVAPIGSKTAEMVQADWIFRTCLLSARVGIQRTTLYWAYDNDPTNPVQYNSMALADKIAGQYLAEAKPIMAGYYYVSTKIISGYEGDIYQNAAGKQCYWIWSPTSTGRSVNYNTGHAGTVYNFVIGGTAMKATATNGSMLISETPLIYFPN